MTNTKTPSPAPTAAPQTDAAKLQAIRDDYDRTMRDPFKRALAEASRAPQTDANVTSISKCEPCKGTGHIETPASSAMSEDELLPCPFCGGVADFVKRDIRGFEMARCVPCGTAFLSPELWNRRATATSTKGATAEGAAGEPIGERYNDGVLWYKGHPPHGTKLYAAPIPQAAATTQPRVSEQADELTNRFRGYLVGTVVTLPASDLHAAADEIDRLRITQQAAPEAPPPAQVAAALVEQAIDEIDQIAAANQQQYADLETNVNRARHERRKFTMADAKPKAKRAADLLRQAWEILAPVAAPEAPASEQQTTVEPVAEKWAIYYDNLGQQPYSNNFMREWHLYDSEKEAADEIKHYTFAKHYRPVRVTIYATPFPAATTASDDPIGDLQAEARQAKLDEFVREATTASAVTSSASEIGVKTPETRMGSTFDGDVKSAATTANPMREYEPGKWENCAWPSKQATTESTSGRDLYEAWAKSPAAADTIGRRAAPAWDYLSASTQVHWNKQAIYSRAPAPSHEAAPLTVSLDAILDCYSPDDTVGDYQDKIRQIYAAAHAAHAGADTERDMLIRLFLGAAYPVSAEINPRVYNWCEAYLDQARAAALAQPSADPSISQGEAHAATTTAVTRNDEAAEPVVASGGSDARADAVVVSADLATGERLTKAQRDSLTLAAATFEALGIAGADNLRAILVSQSAEQAAGGELPPLPKPTICDSEPISAPSAYSADQVLQVQRDAYELGRRAGSNAGVACTYPNCACIGGGVFKPCVKQASAPVGGKGGAA